MRQWQPKQLPSEVRVRVWEWGVCGGEGVCVGEGECGGVVCGVGVWCVVWVWGYRWGGVGVGV